MDVPLSRMITCAAWYFRMHGRLLMVNLIYTKARETTNNILTGETDIPEFQTTCYSVMTFSFLNSVTRYQIKVTFKNLIYCHLVISRYDKNMINN